MLSRMLQDCPFLVVAGCSRVAGLCVIVLLLLAALDEQPTRCCRPAHTWTWDTKSIVGPTRSQNKHVFIPALSRIRPCGDFTRKVPRLPHESRCWTTLVYIRENVLKC